LVEQRTLNPLADSSSLSWPTRNDSGEIAPNAARSKDGDGTAVCTPVCTPPVDTIEDALVRAIAGTVEAGRDPLARQMSRAEVIRQSEEMRDFLVLEVLTPEEFAARGPVIELPPQPIDDVGGRGNVGLVPRRGPGRHEDSRSGTNIFGPGPDHALAVGRGDGARADRRGARAALGRSRRPGGAAYLGPQMSTQPVGLSNNDSVWKTGLARVRQLPACREWRPTPRTA
jgi:hypothetical protein